VAAHVADKLTPAHFGRWARSAEHALVVAVREPARPSRPAPLVVGYALVVLGEPEGEAEAAALRGAVGTGPYTELSKIYVHPHVQGTGVSDSLMEGAVSAATDVARGAGYDAGLPLWLGTNGQNLRAQAFYSRHGFKVVGRRTYEVGGVEHDDVVMLRTPDDR
jgi:tRNA (guanine37-N1)-methyltransferase